MIVSVGAEAPDFELPSSELEGDRPGKKIRLADFRGKKPVVLAFYPLDFSPVCSGEPKVIYDDASAFDAAGAQVLGVSVDSVWAHRAFAKQLGIAYPLLADFHPKGAVAARYGLYHEDKGITARATVVVSKDGKVVYAKEHPLGEARHNQEILEALRRA